MIKNQSDKVELSTRVIAAALFIGFDRMYRMNGIDRTYLHQTFHPENPLHPALIFSPN